MNTIRNLSIAAATVAFRCFAVTLKLARVVIDHTVLRFLLILRRALILMPFSHSLQQFFLKKF